MSSLRNLIRQKYGTHEQITAWWVKFAAVRRRRVWKLSEQQNHHCCYCGRLTWVFTEDRLPWMSKRHLATADHFIPCAEGGSHGLANLVMACERCNNLRGCIDAMVFWEAMQDPKKLRQLIAERSRQIQRNKLVSDQRRAPKRQAFIFNLAYLLYVSPVARQMAADIVSEIDKKIRVILPQFPSFRPEPGALQDSQPAFPPTMATPSRPGLCQEPSLP